MDHVSNRIDANIDLLAVIPVYINFIVSTHGSRWVVKMRWEANFQSQKDYFASFTTISRISETFPRFDDSNFFEHAKISLSDTALAPFPRLPRRIDTGWVEIDQDENDYPADLRPLSSSLKKLKLGFKGQTRV